MTTHVLGIDEAGRGPLAGPVAVGVVVVSKDFDWELIAGVGDSKKVTPKNREAIFRRARVLKKEGLIDYRVRMVGAATIDRIGVTHAVALGIHRALKALTDRQGLSAESVHIKLDGLLKAPEEFIYQETIIHGDALEKVIGLASILAKVTRDRHMVLLGKRYPQYGFEVHKGYGTARHREAVKKYDLCDMHRRSYCRALLNS